MQRRRQPGLTDGKRPPTRSLGVQKLRGRQRGREDRFGWHVQPHIGQAYLQVALGVLRVIGQNQEGDSLRPQVLQKLCRSWDKRRAPHDDPIHICQVMLDIIHLRPSFR